MSVSVYIEAIIPVNSDKYQNMAAVRDACAAAGLDSPHAVLEFFASPVDELGRHVELPRGAMTGEVEYHDGCVVDLSMLPDAATSLRIWTE